MKLGFIGTGNMGGALAKAAAKSDTKPEIILANRTKEKAEKLAKELLVHDENILVEDVLTAAEEADFIFLGVKPQMMEGLLKSLTPVLAKRNDTFVLVTMAAGLTMDSICNMAEGHFPVIRIMPNTPAAIGEGMILYTANDKVGKKQLEDFLCVMKKAGRFSNLDEAHIDAGSAVSGCGPAFAYIFAEALADGGVACGLSRKDAIEYAAQMLAGSAKMILETGENPGKLKDDVCSPGGTTIQGVRRLEECGFRAAAMDAVIAAYEKTLALKK